MKLVGVSSAVPKAVVAAEQAEARLGKEEVERIVRNAGVRKRRVAPPDVTACDLNVVSARALLAELDWPAESVDLLVHVTQTPDHFLPGSAYVAHGKLGLSHHCLAFDISLGCSGFTHGLIVVQALLASGRFRRALLLCGDTISRVTYAEDRGTALLFGDAGSATALEASEGTDELCAAVWGSDGGGTQHLIVPAGGFRQPWNPSCLDVEASADGSRRRPCDLFMDGAQVFNFTLKRVPSMVEDVLAKAQWTRESIDAFVFHQANNFMLDYLRRKMVLPVEKVPISLTEFGNTSCASIPLTMVTRLGNRLGAPTRLVLVGFGVGLSWSAAAIHATGVKVAPLVEV